MGVNGEAVVEVDKEVLVAVRVVHHDDKAPQVIVNSEMAAVEAAEEEAAMAAVAVVVAVLNGAAVNHSPSLSRIIEAGNVAVEEQDRCSTMVLSHHWSSRQITGSQRKATLLRLLQRSKSSRSSTR